MLVFLQPECRIRGKKLASKTFRDLKEQLAGIKRDRFVSGDSAALTSDLEKKKQYRKEEHQRWLSCTSFIDSVSTHLRGGGD